MCRPTVALLTRRDRGRHTHGQAQTPRTRALASGETPQDLTPTAECGQPHSTDEISTARRSQVIAHVPAAGGPCSPPALPHPTVLQPGRQDVPSAGPMSSSQTPSQSGGSGLCSDTPSQWGAGFPHRAATALTCVAPTNTHTLPRARTCRWGRHSPRSSLRCSPRAASPRPLLLAHSSLARGPRPCRTTVCRYGDRTAFAPTRREPGWAGAPAGAGGSARASPPMRGWPAAVPDPRPPRRPARPAGCCCRRWRPPRPAG